MGRSSPAQRLLRQFRRSHPERLFLQRSWRQTRRRPNLGLRSRLRCGDLLRHHHPQRVEHSRSSGLLANRLVGCPRPGPRIHAGLGRPLAIAPPKRPVRRQPPRTRRLPVGGDWSRGPRSRRRQVAANHSGIQTRTDRRPHGHENVVYHPHRLDRRTIRRRSFPHRWRHDDHRPRRHRRAARVHS